MYINAIETAEISKHATLRFWSRAFVVSAEIAARPGFVEWDCRMKDRWWGMELPAAQSHAAFLKSPIDDRQSALRDVRSSHVKQRLAPFKLAALVVALRQDGALYMRRSSFGRCNPSTVLCAPRGCFAVGGPDAEAVPPAPLT